MNPLGPIFSFLSSCTWAYGSANYSKLSRVYRAFDVNFTRALFALPCFVIAVFVVHGGFVGGVEAYRMMDAERAGWLALSILASYAIGDILFMNSTIALGVPGALAIASGYPILTALVGEIREGQAMHGPQWLGLFLSIAGIIGVILHGPKEIAADSADGLSEARAHPFLRKKAVGVALAVVTAFAWATNGYSVMKGGRGLDPAVVNSFRMAIALPFIALIGRITTRVRVRPLDPKVVRRYGGVFILESFFGSYFYVYGLTHSPLVVGSTLAALAPVLSVPIAVAMKLETFSWIRGAAVLTTVVGLSLLFR